MKAGEYQKKPLKKHRRSRRWPRCLISPNHRPMSFLQANIGNKPDGLSDAEIANKIAQRQQAKAQKKTLPRQMRSVMSLTVKALSLKMVVWVRLGDGYKGISVLKGNLLFTKLPLSLCQKYP